MIQPFLLKMELATQDEIDALYTQAIAEMLSDDFCALSFLLSVWGQKPQ